LDTGVPVFIFQLKKVRQQFCCKIEVVLKVNFISAENAVF